MFIGGERSIGIDLRSFLATIETDCPPPPQTPQLRPMGRPLLVAAPLVRRSTAGPGFFSPPHPAALRRRVSPTHPRKPPPRRKSHQHVRRHKRRRSVPPRPPPAPNSTENPRYRAVSNNGNPTQPPAVPPEKPTPDENKPLPP